MKKTDTPASGVLAKLRDHKKAQEGHETFTLPRSGVEVSIPKFRDYGAWEKAQQFGGTDGGAINRYYICGICRFDGEQLKANDYRELIPADDHFVISGKLFNSSPDAAAAPGNG